MAPIPPTVLPVDERDSNWESHSPRFRIYLQSRRDASHATETSVFDLTGVDVVAAIETARHMTGTTMTFAIALVCHDESRERDNPGTGRGLIWLVGHDLNDTDYRSVTKCMATGNSAQPES